MRLSFCFQFFDALFGLRKIVLKAVGARLLRGRDIHRLVALCLEHNDGPRKGHWVWLLLRPYRR